MNIESLIQYMSYALTAVGALAFAVSMVVQAVKEMPGLAKIPTNAVALAVSLALCPVAAVAACQYFKVAITWHCIFASVIAAFIVYLVATGGWERVHEMWDRARYKNGSRGK